MNHEYILDKNDWIEQTDEKYSWVKPKKREENQAEENVNRNVR